MTWYQVVWDFVWKARQRRVDRDILWPSFREQAETIDVARRAFMRHAQNDPAYSYMSWTELRKYVEELPQ